MASRSRTLRTCCGWSSKVAAFAHRACDWLAQASPAAATLLDQPPQQGDNLDSITAVLLGLLER